MALRTGVSALQMIAMPGLLTVTVAVKLKALPVPAGRRQKIFSEVGLPPASELARIALLSYCET